MSFAYLRRNPRSASHLNFQSTSSIARQKLFNDSCNPRKDTSTVRFSKHAMIPRNHLAPSPKRDFPRSDLPTAVESSCFRRGNRTPSKLPTWRSGIFPMHDLPASGIITIILGLPILSRTTETRYRLAIAPATGSASLIRVLPRRRLIGGTTLLLTVK